MGARWAMLYNDIQKEVSIKTHTVLSGRQLYLQTRQNIELTEKLPLVITPVVSNMKNLLWLKNNEMLLQA